MAPFHNNNAVLVELEFCDGKEITWDDVVEKFVCWNRVNKPQLFGLVESASPDLQAAVIRLVKEKYEPHFTAPPQQPPPGQPPFALSQGARDLLMHTVKAYGYGTNHWWFYLAFGKNVCACTQSLAHLSRMRDRQISTKPDITVPQILDRIQNKYHDEMYLLAQLARLQLSISHRMIAGGAPYSPSSTPKTSPVASEVVYSLREEELVNDVAEEDQGMEEIPNVEAGEELEEEEEPPNGVPDEGTPAASESEEPESPPEAQLEEEQELANGVPDEGTPAASEDPESPPEAQPEEEQELADGVPDEGTPAASEDPESPPQAEPEQVTETHFSAVLCDDGCNMDIEEAVKTAVARGGLLGGQEPPACLASLACQASTISKDVVNAYVRVLDRPPPLAASVFGPDWKEESWRRAEATDAVDGILNQCVVLDLTLGGDEEGSRPIWTMVVVNETVKPPPAPTFAVLHVFDFAKNPRDPTVLSSLVNDINAKFHIERFRQERKGPKGAKYHHRRSGFFGDLAGMRVLHALECFLQGSEDFFDLSRTKQQPLSPRADQLIATFDPVTTRWRILQLLSGVAPPEDGMRDHARGPAMSCSSGSRGLPRSSTPGSVGHRRFPYQRLSQMPLAEAALGKRKAGEIVDSDDEQHSEIAEMVNRQSSRLNASKTPRRQARVSAALAADKDFKGMKESLDRSRARLTQLPETYFKGMTALLVQYNEGRSQSVKDLLETHLADLDIME